MITIGSLFSGYGGLDRGVTQGLAVLGHRSRVVWHAEKDPYARAVLARHWPTVRCYEDVHDIDATATRPRLIGGGFPCQDLSIAGKRAGIDGARSGLWSQYERIVRVLLPDLVFVENVPELLRYLGRVLGPLAELGYDAEWDLFDAAAVGAPHRRERLFLLAYRPGALADADGDRQLQPEGREQGERRRAGDDGADVPDAHGGRLADAQQQVEVAGRGGHAGVGDDGRARALANTDGIGREGGLAGGLAAPLAAAPRPLGDPKGDGRRAAGPNAGEDGCEAAADGAGRRWAPEPDVGRVVDGPASRLDARRRRARLRCLGNGAVEQQVALALVTLARRAGLGHVAEART